MAEAFDYQVFGLRVRSEIPLPDLFPAEEVAPPDVTIRKAALPAIGGEEGLRTVGDALLLTIPEVAKYQIENGSEILVDAAPDVPERNVRLFLLGSAFGALLHQRGLLPLHANAIEIDGKAVAFMGESGAGKSTLAAWFHDRGFRVIADDVCVVGFSSDGIAHAAPGLPRLRLWREAIELSGRRTDGYERSYVSAAGAYEKFDVPVGSTGAAREKLPIGALYVLDRADEFSICRLEGMEAAEAVFAHTYRGGFVASANARESHWASAVRLVRSVPAYRIGRPWSLERIDEQYRQLLKQLLSASCSPQPCA